MPVFFTIGLAFGRPARTLSAPVYPFFTSGEYMAFLDFLKPQWKHSDPVARAAAIRALADDQQSLLLSLALEDVEPANRLLAARRVKDAEMLKKLRDKSTDRAIKDLAQKQWVESQILAAQATAKDQAAMDACRSALENVGDDQKGLEEIARGAAILEIRSQAFAKLIHAGAFQAVALSEENETLALRALEKVTRESHLEALAKSARSKAVRGAAKERLKSLVSAKGPDVASINRAKLSLVLSVADKAGTAAEEPPPNYAWEQGKNQLDEAEAALNELIQGGAALDGAKLARFRDSASKFRTRYARWQHERNEREAKEKAALESKARKEAVCARLESMWNETPAPVSPGIADVKETIVSLENASAPGMNPETLPPVVIPDPFAAEAVEIRSLRDQFLALGSGPEAENADLFKRFRTALERLERRARDRETTTRRQTEEIVHGGKLADLCAQAEALAQLPALQAAERLREIRREWTKSLAAAGNYQGREEYRARYEAAIASTHSAVERLRTDHLERMRALLPELEGLLEAPDMLQAEKRFKILYGEWKSLAPAPVGLEADALLGRYQAFHDQFREAQDWLRWSNLRAKQAICDHTEALLAQEDRKSMVARFRELQAEWKSLGPVPWDSSEALWDRYHHACDALYEKCREYFAELDVERESNLKAKEELCARVEAIPASQEIDWREAMETVKEAQGAWKTLGAVPKAQNEAVWNRFRSACNAFFALKDGHNQDNLGKKIELIELVEALKDSTEWKSAGIKIKEAQEKWKTVGPVPRDQAEGIWSRFHGACEHFFQARRAYHEQLEQERPQNQARKEALCAAMEAIDALSNDAERFERIKEAQAAWKEIPPISRDADEQLWERFRKPIDAYFESRKARVGEERKSREENAKIKEDICIEAESLIGSTEWKATIDKIKSLQERWKATGPAPREMDRELWRRFRSACDAFFDRLKETSAKRDQERGSNLKRKTDLCFLAELYLSQPLTEPEVQVRAAWLAAGLPVDLARFKPKEGSVDWNDATARVKAIQQEWKRVGPVPREISDALWERFHAACDGFFEERRVALGLRPEDPQANLEKKLDLIADAEGLAQNPGPESARHVVQLQREWRQIGPVPRAQSDYVWQRFTEACNAAYGQSENQGPNRGGHDNSGGDSAGDDVSQSEPADSASPV